MARKTYNEKLNDSKNMPRIQMLQDPAEIARYGGEKMLLAPALYYDEIMKKIPEGMLITSDKLRAYLAEKNSADFTCPLTAGIFINVAAHASAERAGTDETPYWRTLRKDGELNEKYPGGMDRQKILLELEGHKIIQKGKRYFVENYKEKLFDIKAAL